MSRFCRAVALLPIACGFGGLGLDQWCPGLHIDDMQLQDDSAIDVIWAQAALFSANNGSQALGELGLFHTAVIFKQGSRAWTLEFDNAANNMDTAPSGAGNYPIIDETKDIPTLSWDWNAARWCLTDGVLWGPDHWKKSYEKIATITPDILRDLFADLINPTNASDPRAPPFYNTWHIRTRVVQDQTFVQDITCGNGAVWVRDYLISRDVAVKDGLSVTRIHVNVESVQRVGPGDDDWSDVVSFYKSLRDVYAGDGNLIDKFIAMLNVLPVRYAFDGNNATHPYLKLHGLDTVLPEKINFETAPVMWGPIPGPHGPIPAPPAPAPAPVPAGDYYGKPTDDGRCQPGEELFQVPISLGGVAKVCAPQCVGGPPKGTCPAAPEKAPGFWATPNCDNPDSIIPGPDCVLRCGPVPFLCDVAGGAECFAGGGFGGLLGVCMYRFPNEELLGLPHVQPWNATDAAASILL